MQAAVVGTFPVHMASSAVTPAWSVHKSRGDNVVRMWIQLKRWCVGVLQMGHSGDGCDLASALCKYDLRKVFCSGLGNGVTSEVGKYLVRAANVRWRCAEYFAIASCG